MIVSVSILVGLTRTLIGSWLSLTTKKEKQKMKAIHVTTKAKALAGHCDRLSLMNSWLGKESFLRRKGFFGGPSGYLARKGEEAGPPDMSTMMQGQNNIFSNMKGMVVMMVTSMAMLYWANLFYSGMVIARVPFPLTQRFRGMIQRGLEIESLEVSFISGMCFYFIVMIGLGSYTSLFMDE